MSTRDARGRVMLAAGFTLIEVMVVVFIIGILATLMMVSYHPSESRVVEDEAKRIAALLRLAREEAILDAKELSLTLTEKGYSFDSFDGESWLPTEGDDVLRPRSLPENIKMAVELPGQPLKLVTTSSATETASEESGKEEQDPAAQKVAPDGQGQKKPEKEAVRIFVLSTGEQTPFELFLHLADEEGGWLVKGNAIGDLELSAIKKDIKI